MKIKHTRHPADINYGLRRQWVDDNEYIIAQIPYLDSTGHRRFISRSVNISKAGGVKRAIAEARVLRDELLLDSRVKRYIKCLYRRYDWDPHRVKKASQRETWGASCPELQGVSVYHGRSGGKSYFYINVTVPPYDWVETTCRRMNIEKEGLEHALRAMVRWRCQQLQIKRPKRVELEAGLKSIRKHIRRIELEYGVPARKSILKTAA